MICSICGDQVHSDGGTLVDNSNGDVCGLNGGNSPHTIAIHPDEIMTDFFDGAQGKRDVDMFGTLWLIINDLLDSVKLALENSSLPEAEQEDVYATVAEYAGRHYGG